MASFPPKRKIIKGDSFLITDGCSDPNLLGTQYIGVDSWLYSDPNEHSLVLKVALSWGFDLPSFDTWLENLEQCKAKTELIDRRKNLNKESETLKGSLEFLKVQMLRILQDDVKTPFAIFGSKQKARLSKGGTKVKIKTTEKSDELSNRISAIYISTKLDHERKDIAFYNSHVIAAFSNKYKDEKVITNYLIRKAMAAPRTAL